MTSTADAAKTFYQCPNHRRDCFVKLLGTIGTHAAISSVAWAVGFAVNGFLLNNFLGDFVLLPSSLPSLDVPLKNVHKVCELVKPSSELCHKLNQSMSALQGELAQSSLYRVSGNSLPVTFLKSLAISSLSVGIVLYQLLAFTRIRSDITNYRHQFVYSRVVGEMQGVVRDGNLETVRLVVPSLWSSSTIEVPASEIVVNPLSFSKYHDVQTPAGEFKIPAVSQEDIKDFALYQLFTKSTVQGGIDREEVTTELSHWQSIARLEQFQGLGCSISVYTFNHDGRCYTALYSPGKVYVVPTSSVIGTFSPDDETLHRSPSLNIKEPSLPTEIFNGCAFVNVNPAGRGPHSLFKLGRQYLQASPQSEDDIYFRGYPKE